MRVVTDWDRVEGDRALLSAASTLYRGSGALVDQLWWIAHPGERSPSGREDPAVSVEAARRALYRRGGDGDADAVSRAEASLREDRARATAAVQEALRLRPSAVSGASRRPRPRPLIAAAMVVGVVLGVVVDRTVLSLATPADRAAGSPAAFRVFERQRRPADLPAATAIPTFVRRSSIRLLRPFSSIGTSVYGARTPDDRVCLVAVVLSGRSAATCTSPRAFVEAGCSLVIVASADPIDDSGRRPSDELEFLWDADGTLSVTPVPR